VHRAYAKKAKVELPPLEEYEMRRSESKVIQMPAPSAFADGATTAPPNGQAVNAMQATSASGTRTT
jgi:hypothetical protein